MENCAEKELNKQKYIFVIRHGERADQKCEINLSLLKCEKYDTELTENGKLESQRLGKTISTFLKEKNIDNNKIKFVSSPFARTLMTAKHLIQGMEITESSIYVEHGISEILSRKLFPISPENFLVSIQTIETEEKIFLNKMLI